MSKRKFYKTIFTVEVLSEDFPVKDLSLKELAEETVHGDYSAQTEITKTEQLTGKEAADALVAQGSDPEFFMLDEEGNDVGTGGPEE